MPRSVKVTLPNSSNVNAANQAIRSAGRRPISRPPTPAKTTATIALMSANHVAYAVGVIPTAARPAVGTRPVTASSPATSAHNPADSSNARVSPDASGRSVSVSEAAVAAPRISAGRALWPAPRNTQVSATLLANVNTTKAGSGAL